MLGMCRYNCKYYDWSVGICESECENDNLDREDEYEEDDDDEWRSF